MARRKHGESEDRGEGFNVRVFIAYLSSFCILALFAALLVGAVAGMRPLELRAARIVDTAPVVIQINWPPLAAPAKAAPVGAAPAPTTWLPRDEQERLAAIARTALSAGRDTFSRAPLERIGLALAGSGWFDGAPTVRRDRGSRITVDGRWRIPAAVVRHEGMDHLIAWDAKPLPPIYKPPTSGLRFILGPAIGPPRTTSGERDFASPWPGEDIAASLELLALIAERGWAKQVGGVDASAFSDTRQLSIVTTEGTRVVWGGRPQKPLVGEVSTGQKLAHISQLLQDTRRIDGGYPLVRIYHPTVYFDISASASAQTP